MSLRTDEALVGGCAVSPFFIYLYFIICYIVNFYKFVTCDFEAPFRDEIVHGIGVFTFLGSGITAWM